MIRLTNGTEITIGDDWCLTTLPGGIEIRAIPNDQSSAMAEKLGYGDDVASMTREHDPLHAELTDWLGMPYSLSLMKAAGEPVDEDLANLEEEAVLKVQELRQRWRKSL